MWKMCIHYPVLGYKPTTPTVPTRPGLPPQEFYKFYKQTIQFLQQIKEKKCHVHPVYGAGIWPHDLHNVSLLP